MTLPFDWVFEWTKFIKPSSSDSSDYSGVFSFFGGECSSYFLEGFVYFLPFYYFEAFSYLIAVYFVVYFFSSTLAGGY